MLLAKPDMISDGVKLSRILKSHPKTLGKPATIKDVASHAGVSYQTVSRVINGHPAVKAATRVRVENAIQVFNYHPNGAARSLVSQRSTTLGIISFGTTFYGPAQMVASIEQAARLRGYGLSYANLSALSILELTDAIKTLRRQSVGGLLIVAPLLEVETASLESLCKDLPFVLIDAESSAKHPFSAIDQFAGGRLSAEHLIALGHRNIALLSGPQTWYDAKLRNKGWRTALHHAKLEPVQDVAGNWSAGSGYQATKQLLERCSFTGLLVGNDQMALGALRALHEHGLRIPEDVSVVGFDNMPETAFFEPPLTTVEQDFASLGQRSLEQLIALIEKPELAPRMQVIVPKLIERSSTAVAQTQPSVLKVKN